MKLPVLGTAIFAVLFFLGCPPSASAQDVTLTSRDGSIQLDGTLLSYDGEFYRVDTDYGVLTLNGQGVVCSGVGCPDLQAFVARFMFSGSPVMGKALMPALIEAFATHRAMKLRRDVIDDTNFQITLLDSASNRPVAEIGFRLNSTSEGFADLLTDDADIAMALREIRPNEAARATEAGLGDLTYAARRKIVALDALVPVVAPDNPKSVMAVTQMSGILSGRITDWEDLRAPIAVHGASTGAGLQEVLFDQVLGDIGLQFWPGAQRHSTVAEISDAVAADPFAFATTLLSEIGSAKPLPLEGRCGMRLSATRRTLKTEDYPFTLPLMLYSPARRLPLLAREFLDYLSTPAAQRVVRRAGFVDQARETIATDQQGERLANAIAAAGPEVPLEELQRLVTRLHGAVRLTTTFRFRGGSVDLDAQSAGNITDLALALEAGAFDDRELLFVGFSDGEGDWAANSRIAQKRAETVRNAVRNSAISADLSRARLNVASFGEALPMACDDAEWGRRVNRRVEVWLR